jgi:hypothetical protein
VPLPTFVPDLSKGDAVELEIDCRVLRLSSTRVMDPACGAPDVFLGYLDAQATIKRERRFEIAAHDVNLIEPGNWTVLWRIQLVATALSK